MFILLVSNYVISIRFRCLIVLSWYRFGSGFQVVVNDFLVVVNGLSPKESFQVFVNGKA